MCAISNVMDNYNPFFPKTVPEPVDGGTYDWQKLLTPQAPDLTEMRKLIDEFKQAVEHARQLDVLMKQPDCIDPEKAKLLERVERLEKIIDALLAQKVG